MITTDPTADLFTRIRNAARARKEMVNVPYSKMKEAICKLLKEENYVQSLTVIGEGVEKTLQIELDPNRSDIHLKSMSKPGQRIYVKSGEIPRVLDGLGLAILSTPKGIMSGNAARKAKLGGRIHL